MLLKPELGINMGLLIRYGGLLLCLISYATSVVNHDIIVETKYGKLLGTREEFNYDLGTNKVTGTVDKFKGVPFAKPPVGELRFKPPVPPDPWTGLRNASQYGWVCPQIGFFHPETTDEFQNEDCLVLDIYSPYQPDKPDALYPVMMYIHGGSYEVGSGRLYNGQVLAMYGIVVVTINYRLGALGFLTSGNETMAGNYGILDQVQALKWVNENIRNFRGDPDKVTIFGHSAGGASVGLILTIPAANGLYRSAIAQSGSATASYSCHHPSMDFIWYVEQVGLIFNCHAPSTKEIVDCLRKVPAQQFIRRRKEFPWFDPIDPEFRPVVDGSVLPDSPRKLLEEGNFHKVPFLMGTVKNEFGNYFNGGARHKPAFDKALDSYVNKITGNRPALLDLVMFEYTDWRVIQHIDGASPFYDRGALLSDMHMVAPTVDIATLVAKYQEEVYQYHFSTHQSYHSVELNYVFGAPFSDHFADEMTAAGGYKNFSEMDKECSRLIMTMWTNFAKYGKPTLHSDTSNLDWKTFSEENKAYLHMSVKEAQMKQHLRAEKVRFWNVLFPRLKASMEPLNFEGLQNMSMSQYHTHMYAFLGIAGVLLVLIVILLFFLIRSRMSNERFRHWTRTYENGSAHPARV